MSLNGNAEDLYAILGSKVAKRLMNGKPTKLLHVPKNASEDHELAKLLGIAGMRALCREYGGERLYIPIDEDDSAEVILSRLIADWVKAGHKKRDIANLLKMSQRQICVYIAKAENWGFIKMILDGKNDEDEKGQAA